MLFYYIPYRNDKIVDLNTVFYFTHKIQCLLMCVMKSIKKISNNVKKKSNKTRKIFLECWKLQYVHLSDTHKFNLL